MNFFKNVPCLTSEAAKVLVDAATQEAYTKGWDIAVCVVNAQGIAIHAQCMEGASLTAPDMAQAKAVTALREGRSTTVSAERAAKRPGIVKFPGYMPVGGGLPVPEFRSDNSHLVIPRFAGAVGISGRTAEEDEVIARAAYFRLEEKWRESLPPRPGARSRGTH